MSRLNEKLKFRVSPEDVERIKVKMEDAGIMSMSAYIRKMALDGICVRMDLGDVRQLVILLRRCSNNLEQYARKANETGSGLCGGDCEFTKSPGRDLGINQTVPRPACRYSIAAAMNGFAVFPVFFKGRRPRLSLLHRDNSVREPNA